MEHNEANDLCEEFDQDEDVIWDDVMEYDEVPASQPASQAVRPGNIEQHQQASDEQQQSEDEWISYEDEWMMQTDGANDLCGQASYEDRKRHFKWAMYKFMFTEKRV